MGKRKLKKFREVAQMPNVYQNFSFHHPQLVDSSGHEVDMKGQWHSHFFKNENPITLELACGRGEYTVGLARMFPNRNFIGLDIKGTRIWMGAKEALEEPLPNVAFVRTRIELIEHFFANSEVDEIWITFADPFLGSSPNRRLTSPVFLDRYRNICKKGALIHLKTDDPTLFNYSVSVAQEQQLPIHECQQHIYATGIPQGPLAIKTYYEGLDISKSSEIKYLQFSLD